MLTIFVDGDACPVKEEIYRVARRYGCTVTIVANSPMRIPREEWLSLVVVDDSPDASDDWIAERSGPGDVVVTADIELAARCLKNGSAALGHKGVEFTRDNIGVAMATREILSGLRDIGEFRGGPPPFRKQDRSKFLQVLDLVMTRMSKTHPRQGGA